MQDTSAHKRRTVLYARVSTADQKTGLESQVRALRIFCEQNKIENYELFCDENISGTKASRPGLNRMMKAVESNEVDSVVVFAFSRFANLTDWPRKTRWGQQVIQRPGRHNLNDRKISCA